MQAVNSTHIWKASIPATLEPGTYRITANARDEYGRGHTAHAVLEVVAQADSPA